MKNNAAAAKRLVAEAMAIDNRSGGQRNQRVIHPLCLVVRRIRPSASSNPSKSKFAMARPPDPSVSNLRALQQEAERMARLSPFAADRDRFNRIARRYRDEADQAEQDRNLSKGV